MTDTVRTLAQLQSIFADGQAAGSITPQDARDFIITTALAFSAATIVTSGASYAATATDGLICVKKSPGSATAVTLPASPQQWRWCIVKDSLGDASTNPITVSSASGTIDGASNVVLNRNYASAFFVYNGMEWNIL